MQRYRWWWLLLALICLATPLWQTLSALDQTITSRMAERHWSLPARVYARPLELYSGRSLLLDDLVTELEWLGYRASPAREPGYYAVNAADVTITTRGFRFSDGFEPARELRLTFDNGHVTAMETRDQAALVRLEPLEIGAIHPARHEDRVLVNHEALPPGFVETLTTVEDRRFFQHHGISLRAIARALWVNLRSGTKRQGASTLTQQLVKNLFLSNEKSWRRKITELSMAIIMDARYDKSVILETFINEVFIAQDGQRAIHGFGLASQYFFGRPLAELEPHQYALLIGMLKAPSNYNPIRSPERALQRRNVILDLMADAGIITKETLAEAQGTMLDVHSGAEGTGANPAYLDAVRRQLLEDYVLEDLQNDGLRIFTAYDPQIQRALESSIDSVLAEPRQQQEDPELSAGVEAAAVVSDPVTAEIHAMVGGRQMRITGFNRALDARRPVGSLLKPAIYLTAWSDPTRYTLASTIPDEPVQWPLPDGSVWAPANYDESTHGPVLSLMALTQSLNLATVQLGHELGLSNIVTTLQRMGLDRPITEVPSLLLGAVALSVMDVLQLYQTIAGDGYQTRPSVIRDVLAADGSPLTHHRTELAKQLDARALYLLKHAMVETMRTGTGRATQWLLPEALTVAGKTGTSDGQRDSWFAGFSGDQLAVVWLGNDHNEPTRFTGSSGALRVWASLMSKISRRPLDLTPPDGIVSAKIHPTNGRRVPSSCPTGLALPFIEGSVPTESTRCPGTGVGDWLRQLFRRGSNE